MPRRRLSKSDIKIVYQSKSIPELVIDERQLALLKERFPSVTSFRQYVLDAEAWLLDPANAKKYPKLLFRFIYNWIDKALMMAPRNAKPGPQYGDSAKADFIPKAKKEAYLFEKKDKKDRTMESVHSLTNILNTIKEKSGDTPTPQSPPLQEGNRSLCILV